MTKNVQITEELHSFHILAKLCSKSSELDFNSMWTEKFQMFKLDLEKAGKPEIKLPTSVQFSTVAQSCPTLCDPMDCSLPGSSVHGILQARVLEWVAISFSRRSPQPRDRPRVSHIMGRCFTIWATREDSKESQHRPWVALPGRNSKGSAEMALSSAHRCTGKED